MNTIAVQQVLAEYHGEAAHAAAFPHLGRNALDAAVLGYVNVAALRQHIRGDERVHGVFTDGGDKPNIVPAHAATHWYVRSRTLATLEPLKERVLACLQAGADAAGCTMTHRWLEPAYADLVDNSVLVDLFTANAAVVGRDLRRPAPGSTVVGSTDMGNVSYEVPGIHPMLRVAPPGVSIHTPEFARYAAGPEGDAAVLDGAKAMAMTIVDLWLQPTTLVQVNEAFSNERAR